MANKMKAKKTKRKNGSELREQKDKLMNLASFMALYDVDTVTFSSDYEKDLLNEQPSFTNGYQHRNIENPEFIKLACELKDFYGLPAFKDVETNETGFEVEFTLMHGVFSIDILWYDDEVETGSFSKTLAEMVEDGDIEIEEAEKFRSILSKGNIGEINHSYSGGGDSGGFDGSPSVSDKAGKATESGIARELEDRIEELTYNLMDLCFDGSGCTSGTTTLKFDSDSKDYVFAIENEFSDTEKKSKQIELPDFLSNAA